MCIYSCAATPVAKRGIFHRGCPVDPPTAQALVANAEIRNLRRWKEEALPVLGGLQELGRALSLRPGELITGPAAVIAVESLRANLAAAEVRMAELVAQNARLLEDATHGPCMALIEAAEAKRDEWAEEAREVGERRLAETERADRAEAEAEDLRAQAAALAGDLDQFEHLLPDYDDVTDLRLQARALAASPSPDQRA